MEIYERLSKEELADLLKAYDCYISTAADAGRLLTGWTPVCVAEFYSCEYQDVWRQGQNFDYMYDFDEKEQLSENIGPAEFIPFNDVNLFIQDGQLMCRFNDEEKLRPIRSRIQDILDGDAFFVGSGVHYSDGDAHRNTDEPDEPWIVYDVGGDSWFEEDVVDPAQYFPALKNAQEAKNISLAEQIESASAKASLHAIAQPASQAHAPQR